MRTRAVPQATAKIRQAMLALRSFVEQAWRSHPQTPDNPAKEPAKTSSGESAHVSGRPLEAAIQAPKVSASKATIVCVDEDPTALERLRMVLTEESFEVVAVSGAGVALEYIWKRVPDLLVIDPMMDSMAGFDLCRRLRAHPETDHIPIVLHTAAPAPTEASLYDCVCSKPAERSALLLVIRTLLL
jgi:PleD family two-component response regulator